MEVAAKIADALDVSLDYLVGASSFVVKDKKMLHRLELLEKIDTDDRDTILSIPSAKYTPYVWSRCYMITLFSSDAVVVR